MGCTRLERHVARDSESRSTTCEGSGSGVGKPGSLGLRFLIISLFAVMLSNPAPVLADNLATDSWNQTTDYPTDIWAQSCVTDGGYVYCIGGFETTAVYYAPLTSGGLWTWRMGNNNYSNSVGVNGAPVSSTAVSFTAQEAMTTHRYRPGSTTRRYPQPEWADGSPRRHIRRQYGENRAYTRPGYTASGVRLPGMLS